MASTINASTTLGLISSADTSGVLQLQTNGTPTVTVVTSGNMGVGTASPSTKLDVVGQYIRVQQAGAMAGYAIKDTTANKSAFFQYTQGSSLFIGAEGNTPIIFANTDSLTTRATIDSSGNLGLGVTPSAWSGNTALQNKSASIAVTSNGNNMDLATNRYNNGTNDLFYQTGNYALMYEQASGSGAHRWFTSTATGTAGNAISFTQAMTLDASGNLGVGTTSPDTRLDVTRSGNGQIAVLQTTANRGFSFDSQSDTALQIASIQASTNMDLWANTLSFSAGGSERARIDSSGRMGIGTGNPNERLTLASSAGTGAAITFWGNGGTSGNELYVGQGGSNEAYVWNRANNFLAFGTNGTERARISSSGDLLVAVTTAVTGYKMHISGAVYQDQTANGTSGTPTLSGGYVCGPGDANVYAGIRFLNSYLSNNASQLAFYVTNTTGSAYESARINSAGYFKASNTGAYYSPTGNYHEFNNSVGDYTVVCRNNASSLPYGIYVRYNNSSPNGTGSEFLSCDDSTATRATIRSNGGLANYSANNVNLSDVRTKTDIQDAGGYLAKICAIPVRTFKYKDQTDDLLNLGCIAQEVEAVAPELVDVNGFGETPEDGVPLKAIYQTDLQYALMKCIQEQQAIIQQLQADVAALKG